MKIRLSYFKSVLLIFLLGFLTVIYGCKKFIEVDAPKTSINQENIYTNNTNAISALTAIYTKMSSSTFSLQLSIYPELSADNLTLYDLNNSAAITYYLNKLSPRYQTDLYSTVLWNDLYQYIYYCNSAIAGLSKTNDVSKNVKQHLMGEAYFLRAFFYFYLENLYQNVPIVLTTDYSINSKLFNSSADEVLGQIESDLKMAQNLLTNEYLDKTLDNSTQERIRPNAMAATALLARLHLFRKNWVGAEEEASKVINATSLYILPDLRSAFLKNSSETIWALQPVSFDVNTKEGEFYIYSSEGPNSTNYTYLSSDLLQKFEAGDDRRNEWVGAFIGGTIYYYPTKYKIKNGDPSSANEYTIVLRLAEQYLIRAEAKIQQGKINEGIADINVIRKRARSLLQQVPNPLPEIGNDLTKENALEAVLNERRLELFTEWGFRWFDLRRTNKIDAIMPATAILKGSEWNSYQSLYPIPAGEISSNINLIQNPGYK